MLNREDDNYENKVNDKNAPSLLHIPKDIIRAIPASVERDSIQIMRKLSQTCTTFRALFKPNLKNEGAYILLQDVLYGNDKQILHTASVNPELFFISATAMDYMCDLDGNRRIIKNWSPYQALFGISDIDMLKNLQPFLLPYLKSIPNGMQMADKQVKEKFPNGFDFPTCTSEFIEILRDLSEAIRTDRQLSKTGNASDPTAALMLKFRNFVKPGTVETGHHFNMNHIYYAQITFRNYHRQGYFEGMNKYEYFEMNIIGYLQRFLTSAFLKAITKGVEDIEYVYPEGFEAPIRSSFDTLDSKKAVFVNVVMPENPTYRLGVNFLIDAYAGKLSGPDHGPITNSSNVAPIWNQLMTKHIEALVTFLPSNEAPDVEDTLNKTIMSCNIQ